MAFFHCKHGFSSARMILLLLFMSAILSEAAQGQENYSGQYDDQHFTDENGLPQNSVKSIIADKDGFIWLATENGLVRYDGSQFKVFDNSIIPLQSNRMSGFYPGNSFGGDDNSSFFALSDGHDYLDVRNGNVHVRDAGYEKFLSGMPFSREFNEGKAFIGQALPTRFRQVTDTGIYILPDGTDGFFVCAPQLISYYRGLREQYRVRLPQSHFLGFFRQGTALLWANEEGIFNILDKDTLMTLQVTGDLLRHPAYRKGTRNFDIYWSNASGQAFVYLEKSLYILHPGTRGELETQLVLTGFDRKINNIISVYYDVSSRMVFLGSLNKGLFTFSPRQFRTLSIGDEDKDNIYYAQAAWDKDRIVTPQGNVLSLAGSFVLPALKKEGETDKYSMLIDRKGFIWTKSGHFINKFDKAGKILLAQWDLGGEITQLYEGKDGQLWIGSNEIGLFRIDPYEQSPVPHPFATRSALHGMSCLAQEGADVLWVGTGKGLFRVSLRDGSIDTVKGLENFYIRSLSIPSPGEIWITTYEAGFFLYSNLHLTGFPMDKAGYLATAHCFVEDDQGFCWIPTNKGLFQASKKDLLNYAAGKQQEVFYLYHTREEGFYTNEFNGGCQPCAVKLENGFISLPSLNGVVWFSPASLRTRLPDKNIFIDRIEIDNTRIQPKDTVTLSRGFKLLRLYFSTPYIGNEYNLNLQYALVKGNEPPVWLPLDNNRIISLSSLVHGDYTLTIRKINGFGSNNYGYRKLMVIVPPAFYETYWFYGLLVLLFILLLSLYARLRLRYVKQKNRQLEQMVGDRTAELTSALGALSLSEQNIRRQLHVRKILFTSISHDIGSPLKYITLMAEELKEGLEKADVAVKMKSHADNIFQSGHYLYHLTRNLLQYLRISEENSALQFERFDLHRLVEKKVFIFQPIARERSVAIVNDIPVKFYLYNDPLLLEVVIHNLLDNAIKATRQGSVTFRVEVIDEEAHLVIEDTGPGMRKEIARLFTGDDAVKDGDTSVEDAHSGYGLRMVKELTSLIDVRLRIETGSGGTAVRLIFRRMKE